MISVHELVKRYGPKTAVDGLSFEVDKGEVVGFLGPNGAGKSSTLRIVAGFLGLTSGKVTVCGHDIVKESFEARQKVGYMPEAVPLYPEMRVAEYLAFRAELKRVARGRRAAFVEEAMVKAHVDDVADVLIGHLSKGYRQRVGLADALVAKPPLLVLDEPTAGLDPNQIREVRDVLTSLGKEHTVLVSTHILAEVEATCSRVVLIAKGKLVADGPLEELGKKRRAAGLTVVVRGDASLAKQTLRAVAGLGKVEEHERATEPGVVALRCRFEKKRDVGEVAKAIEDAVAALVAAGLGVREVAPIRSSFEEVFAELTEGSTESAA